MGPDRHCRVLAVAGSPLSSAYPDVVGFAATYGVAAVFSRRTDPGVAGISIQHIRIREQLK